MTAVPGKQTANPLPDHWAGKDRPPDWLWQSPGRFACLVAAFLVAVFPKILLGWQTFFYRDYGVLAYPFVFFQRQSFWIGEWPLWNPLSNCGAPFLAQWGTLSLYPFSLVYLLLPLPWSLSLFCFAHLALGAVGVYLLARRWVQHPFGSAVAGLVYVFNGITLSCLLWPNYTVALGWLPWVILLTERGWRQGGRWVVFASLASALQLLSGVPEVILFTWLVVGAFWVRDICAAAPDRWRLPVRLGLMVLLAAGLAAAQLLPFFDLLIHSQRGPEFASAKWAMPGWGWANLVVPLFHCFQTPQGTFFQFGQAFISSYYLGTILLVLAVWAAWKVRQGSVWILSGLVLFSLIMALGDSGWVYTWLRSALPFLGLGRYPVKFIILAAFTVPMLAAFALAHLEAPENSGKNTRRSLLAFTLATALIMIGVLWIAKIHPFPYDQWDVTLKNTLWRFLFLGASLACLLASLRTRAARAQFLLRATFLVLLVADIVSHKPNQNPTLSSSVMAPDFWEQHQDLPPPRHGQARVMITPEAEKHLLRSTVEDHLKDFLGKRLALWSNLNLLDGIPKVNGSSTLQLRPQKEVQDLLYQETNTVAEGLIDFLAVSLRTSTNSVVEWTPRSTHLPWITGGQKPVYADPEETLRQLARPDFDPRAVVYLPPEARAETALVDASSCRIDGQTFSQNRISFQVETPRPSLIVIAQSFYHPWKAYIDGNPATLWRANHAFQALVVPEGAHRVQLKYQDRRFQLGCVFSIATLILCAGLLLRQRRGPGTREPARGGTGLFRKPVSRPGAP